MKREKENDISYCISMGSKSSKSTASEKEFDINEKTKTDILLFNTLKDCIESIID